MSTSCGWSRRRMKSLVLGLVLLAGSCETQRRPLTPLSRTAARPARPVAARTIVLAPGEIATERLAGGETHAYIFQLENNQLADLVVDQRGIDVAVTLYAPDGRRLTKVDSPNNDVGPEPRTCRSIRTTRPNGWR